MPFSPQRFDQLDGLRGAAALIVLLHHYWPQFHLDPTGGRVGADLFFVLSGFLITRTLLKARRQMPSQPLTALGEFYRKRVLRVFPLYFLTLAVVALLGWGHFQGGLPWHATFLSNFYFVREGFWADSAGHLWTLAVEQHFYLFWPLVLLFAPWRQLHIWAGLLVAGGLVFRAAAGIHTWSFMTIDILTPGAFETLGAGSLLGIWAHREGRLPARNDRRLLTLGAVGLVLVAIRGLLPEGSAAQWLSLTSTELSRALLLTVFVHQAAHGFPGWFGKMLSSAPARWLGAGSFGIYLSHNFFKAGLPVWHWQWQGIALQPFVALLATLIWAALAYWIIERPFQQMRRRPAAAEQPLSKSAFFPA